jgi:hypothetical protein
VIEECTQERAAAATFLGLSAFEYVIGVSDNSLTGLDLDVSSELEDPRKLVYLAIEAAYRMTTLVSYDYVLIIEDDVRISGTTLRSLLGLLSTLPNSEVVVPNRQESLEGNSFCVDMFALPGWQSDDVKDVGGYRLAVPVNAHCEMLFLDVDRFRFGYENRRFQGHERFFADYMESAFANVYSAFKVLRALPTDSALPVEHCDSWLARLDQRGGMGTETPLDRIASIRVAEALLQQRDINSS